MLEKSVDIDQSMIRSAVGMFGGGLRMAEVS